MKWISKKEEDTQEIAIKFLRIIKEGSTGESAVVGLIGELGAGKTTFVKFCAKELGVLETVTSPTFVILKTYDIINKDFSFRKMVHVDCYRLNKESDLHVLGVSDAIKNPANLVFIEWADRVGLDKLKNSIKLDFSHVNETTRVIEMSEN